jgi:hypothetical protein
MSRHDLDERLDGICILQCFQCSRSHRNILDGFEHGSEQFYRELLRNPNQSCGGISVCCASLSSS